MRANSTTIRPDRVSGFLYSPRSPLSFYFLVRIFAVNGPLIDVSPLFRSTSPVIVSPETEVTGFSCRRAKCSS